MGKKIAAIVVSCNFNYMTSQVSTCKKSFYGMLSVMFNIFRIKNEMACICRNRIRAKDFTKKRKPYTVT